ncbi:MAG: FecR domain-containing protein [Pseudobdellovibrionaceae bacterium]|nr:MAG: FecR domain-containing protein [Pseudobdellovibrionaceae bacterium]
MNSISFFVTGFSILVCLTFSPWAEATRVHGVFRVVKGKVEVTSSKSGQAKRARVGQKVYPGDKVSTGKDARAKIVMVDSNEIIVSPDSQVTLEKYEYSPENDNKDVLLDVIYGKVRSKVKQQYNGKTSQFRVKTRSAVAGVRGTDFFTSYDAKTELTRVVTFAGRVEFGAASTSGQIINPVLVEVGQFTTHKVNTDNPGASPTPPMPVPKNEFSRLNKDSDLDSAGYRPIDPRVLPAEPKRDPDSEGDPGKGTSDRPQGRDTAGAPPKMCPPFCGDFNGEMPGRPVPPPRPPVAGGCPGGVCIPQRRDFVDEVVRDGHTRIIINIEDGPRP